MDLEERCRVLEEVAKDVTASLVAALSILSRTPQARKAVASDTMYDLMIKDYEKSVENARKVLLQE